MTDLGDSNLAAAAITTQIAIIVILVIGAFLIWRAEQRIPYYKKAKGTDATAFGWVLLLLLLFTLVPLVFSQGFASTWSPVFGGLHVPTFPTSTAVKAMFILDIIGLSVIMYYTGGSRESAFSPLLFVIPALALFLRQSFTAVLVYTGILFVCFWCLLYNSRMPPSFNVNDAEQREAVLAADKRAYWLITLLTMGLTTLVAFIADPRWISAT